MDSKTSLLLHLFDTFIQRALQYWEELKCILCLFYLLGSFHFLGLRAGDEILQLNGEDAGVLDLSNLRAAFVQPSLCLSVSTLPAVDRHLLCHLPPRRSDGEELLTDIFSQSQGV